MAQAKQTYRPTARRSAEPILYFAYGSNMSPERMEQRCPGAITLGHAVLPHYRLAERLYADIDLEKDSMVHGVLYLVTPLHLALLDRYEGYPQIYRRGWLEVVWQNYVYKALTYEMTPATKLARWELPFSQEYREICSAGADFHKIPNAFKKTTRRRKK